MTVSVFDVSTGRNEAVAFSMWEPQLPIVLLHGCSAVHRLAAVSSDWPNTTGFWLSSFPSTCRFVGRQPLNRSAN